MPSMFNIAEPKLKGDTLPLPPHLIKKRVRIQQPADYVRQHKRKSKITPTIIPKRIYKPDFEYDLRAQLKANPPVNFVPMNQTEIEKKLDSTMVTHPPPTPRLKPKPGDIDEISVIDLTTPEKSTIIDLTTPEEYPMEESPMVEWIGDDIVVTIDGIRISKNEVYKDI